jgi:hypothetical protein
MSLIARLKNFIGTHLDRLRLVCVPLIAWLKNVTALQPTTAIKLNRLGLVFGIAGTVLLFCYAPPQPSFNPNSYLLLQKDEKHAKDVANEERRYRRLSSLGIGLVCIGFACQLVATWRS